MVYFLFSENTSMKRFLLAYYLGTVIAYVTKSVEFLITTSWDKLGFT